MTGGVSITNILGSDHILDWSLSTDRFQSEYPEIQREVAQRADCSFPRMSREWENTLTAGWNKIRVYRCKWYLYKSSNVWAPHLIW